MENTKDILYVKDVNFSEDELNLINITMKFYSHNERKIVSEYSLSSVVSEIDNLIQNLSNQLKIGNKILELRSKVESYLIHYVVNKDTFDILGETLSSSISEEKFLIIHASNLKEAKEIRDKREAETFPSKNISFEKLLNIINDMERSHGSSTISPELLKHLLKTH